MPDQEFGTKKEEIEYKLRKKIYQHGMNVEDAVREVNEEGDYSEGYVKEVWEKFVCEESEPRSDLQKAIIQAYDEDPSQTYKEIAERAAEILGQDEIPSQSAVSEYTSRFRNDVRREVEEFNWNEDSGDQSGGDRPSYHKNGVQVDPDVVDEVVEEDGGDGGDNNQITFQLDEEDAFQLAKKLIRDGEMEDIAKEILRQYN